MSALPVKRPLQWLSMSAALMALSLPLRAAEEPVPSGGEEGAAADAGKSQADLLLDDVAQEAALLANGREAAAQYHFEQGVKARQASRFPEAIRHLTIACDYQPNNEQYRKELELAASLAGLSRSPASTHVDILNDQLQVQQQQLWVEILSKIEQGKAHLVKGEYHQAQLVLEQARVRLETLPFADPKRPAEMRRVELLLSEVNQRRREFELGRATERNRLANKLAEERRRYELKLERDRVSAMIARAMKARDRRDYDQCILLCEKVLRINNANEMAHDLLAKARRERHVYLRQITADRWDEEHKQLSQHIREQMLPQLDLVVYPDDWHEIDARRDAPVHGTDTTMEAWKQEIRKKLEVQLTLNFPELEIQEVVQFLQRNTDVNFVLDPEVVVSGTVAPITMQVSNIKLSNALEFIMLQTGLKYALQDEAVYITTPDRIQGDAYMKVYDIRDMMVGLTQFPGPSLEIPDPGGTGASLIPEIADDEAPEADEFIEIIREVVYPEAWDSEQVGIEEWSGSLIVTQTDEVHRAIQTMLENLRKQQSVQINVKVKFLSVENALLEEIGVNWNNFGFVGWNAPIAAGPNPSTPAATPPWWIGGYWRSNGANPEHVTGAEVTNELQDYYSASTLNPTGGFEGELQIFEDPEGFLGRVVVNMVEKTRRGNIAIQPDITLMSGQQAHIVRMNQQSYVADYDVVGEQYDPVTTVISYGTVLDVEAIASADRKWITMTLKPTTTEIAAWRRFGSNISDFGGVGVVNNDADGADLGAVAGAYPLMVPELIYKAVETSVTIPDGGSLLIAGFTSSNSSRAHAGIPFLSHIPFLGRLFSSNGRSEREFKDLIYVTGNIILFDEIEEQL